MQTYNVLSNALWFENHDKARWIVRMLLVGLVLLGGMTVQTLSAGAASYREMLVFEEQCAIGVASFHDGTAKVHGYLYPMRKVQVPPRASSFFVAEARARERTSTGTGIFEPSAETSLVSSATTIDSVAIASTIFSRQ